MKSMCKHIPKVGDRPWFFLLLKVHINGWKVGLCIFQLNSQIRTSSLTFSGWWQCLVTGASIFAQKSVSLAKYQQLMCSEQLECFWISSSTMFFGCWNTNFSQIELILGKIDLSNIHQFVTINKSVFSISFRKSSQNLSTWSNKKKYICFGFKKK